MDIKTILKKEEITDCVKIPIIDMISKDAEEFNKYLSVKLCGTEDLTILSYHALKAEGNEICLEVSANTKIFQQNYWKRKMDPEKRIQVLEETLIKRLSFEKNTDIYNTLIEVLDIIGITHTGFSFRKKGAVKKTPLTEKSPRPCVV